MSLVRVAAKPFWVNSFRAASLMRASVDSPVAAAVFEDVLAFPAARFGAFFLPLSIRQMYKAIPD